MAYSLDEGTGSLVSDSSGTSNDGTNFNAAWAVGRFGSGLYFNGRDACTVINSVNNFPSTEITVEFWMRTSDVENAGTVFSYATQSSNDEFRISDYRNLEVYVKGTGMNLQTSVSANDGDWHHIAVTWRSVDGRVLLYKDGALLFSGSRAAGKSLISGGMLVLGQDQDEPGGGFQPSQAFRELLDEVRIYDRVLSGAEIQASMHFRTLSIDLIPPTLTDVAATPGRTHFIITWRTTEVADSQVEYGLTADYGLFSLVDQGPVETHAVTLSALQPRTLYHYRVRSVDPAGNLAVSSDATFTTRGSAQPSELLFQGH